MRILLVHNPKAGDETHEREHLETTLGDAGHDVVYRSVKEDDWRNALRERPELVIVAGGDGSVCEVFITLSSDPIPATILPMGSANNIARTLGFELDADVASSVAAWPAAERRPHDVWHLSPGLEEPCFVESMGGGIFAEVLARANTVDHDGVDKVELGLTLLEEVVRDAREETWELTLDGRRFEERLLALEAMNIHELGPNIALAPVADPGDGLLDVVLIRSEHRAALSAYVEARAEGRTCEPPELDIQRARELVVRPPRDGHLRLDDTLAAETPREPITCTRAAQVEVLVPKVS